MKDADDEGAEHDCDDYDADTAIRDYGRVCEELCEAGREIEGLKVAIRKHRDQREDDRCHLDDFELYAVLDEPFASADAALPPKADFLASCERFYEQRQAPEVKGAARLPGCMTIRQLTDEVDRLRAENDRLAALAAGRGCES